MADNWTQKQGHPSFYKLKKQHSESLDAPSWLLSSVVSLIVVHKTETLNIAGTAHPVIKYLEGSQINSQRLILGQVLLSGDSFNMQGKGMTSILNCHR